MPSKATLLASLTTEELLHAYLDEHPEEWERACGAEAFEQMAAALWMNEHFGMQIDVQTLQKLIEFWGPAGVVAAEAVAGGRLVTAHATTDEWGRAGEFDPNQLIDYLVRQHSK